MQNRPKKKNPATKLGGLYLYFVLVTAGLSLLWVSGGCRVSKPPKEGRCTTPVSAKDNEKVDRSKNNSQEKSRGSSETQPPNGESTAVAASDFELSTLKNRTILFITHPSLRVVRSFHFLIKNKILSADSLFVVGLYHSAEWGDYTDTFQYIAKNNISWFRLRKLTCYLDEEKIFQKNKCTKTFKTLFSHASGIIFTGGADIPPSIFGKKTLLTTVIKQPHRQYWEISFLFHLIGGVKNSGLKPLLEERVDFPVLGICMGLQAMNVAAGGTLVQDIPWEIYGIRTYEAIKQQSAHEVHRNPHYMIYPAPEMWPGVFHPIKFTAAHTLWKEMLATKRDNELSKANVMVMSVHHQAIQKLGRNLEVIATSTDGKVIEAIRHKKYPNVWGMQFHPEYDVIWDPSIPARRNKAEISLGSEPVKNFFHAKLKGDKASMVFHRRFWRAFGKRLK